MSEDLKAPFPWFGGKRRVAHVVWQRFGPVRNYVEPFFGSGAVLLQRPEWSGEETVNDKDCYVANFWRALGRDPDEVAWWADGPINEADLHARHLWLVNQHAFRERMMADPEFFDAQVAGWWVWGISQWIGGGWCTLRERPERKRPQVSADRQGNGIHSIRRQIPRIDAMCNTGMHNDENLKSWFLDLYDRMRRVRVTCGDWSRVCGPTPLGLTSNVPPGFKTAVFFDPPYAAEFRDLDIYAQDCGRVSAEVRAWCIEHGDDERLRIALCGYEGEHAMPDSWECVPWKAAGGYGNQNDENENAAKERIWFSPHCLGAAQAELF